MYVSMSRCLGVGMAGLRINGWLLCGRDSVIIGTYREAQNVSCKLLSIFRQKLASFQKKFHRHIL